VLWSPGRREDTLGLVPFPFLAPGDEHPPGYRVVERPVENGATSLYAVEHVATGRRATLQLFPALPDDASGHEPERFLENVRVCRKIEGDHVASTLDEGVTDRVPWILMDTLPGEDLGKLVARRGALDLDAARVILRALGDALGKAHELGVVHGGLEPGVIFVGATPALPGEPFPVRVIGAR
jgi:serine/threonine protein kinase